jgi:spermidine/putrescine transport system substrate-binding protein
MKKSGYRLGIIFGVAIAPLAAVATIAIAADKDLIIFEWAGYEEPSFHPGYVAKNGDSPTFAFFWRRG